MLKCEVWRMKRKKKKTKQKEMEEKNRKRENAIREGWDTWTFWQVSSTELLEKFSAGCFRPSSIDLPVLLIGGEFLQFALATSLQL